MGQTAACVLRWGKLWPSRYKTGNRHKRKKGGASAGCLTAYKLKVKQDGKDISYKGIFSTDKTAPGIAGPNAKGLADIDNRSGPDVPAEGIAEKLESFRETIEKLKK